MEAFTKTKFSFRYKPGDQVNLTCVCRATYPAANLSWFISGRKASPAWVLPTKVKIEQKSKLLSSHSQILMPPKDKAIVKCVASILVGTAMNYIYYLVLYPRFHCIKYALNADTTNKVTKILCKSFLNPSLAYSNSLRIFP